MPENAPERVERHTTRGIPGGASNLTYLLRYPGRDLILRRPPAGAKAASAHDMGREFRIQSALAPVFPYVARQVGGWIGRFDKARTDDTGDWTDIVEWLDAQQPGDVGQRLIHNDFRFDNTVLAAADPATGATPRIVGVLDWEMATVGDPLMDLGGAMAYWVEPADDEFFQQFRRQPTTAPGMWTRAEIVDHYCDRMGFEMTPERWRFYEVFGLFRLAVIAQQIWYRYVHQQTTNEAYAAFGQAVGYLKARCRSLVSTGPTGAGD